MESFKGRGGNRQAAQAKKRRSVRCGTALLRGPCAA